MIPNTATDEQLETYVSNIVSAVQSATPDQIERGTQWYPVAHDLAYVLGNGDIRMGAGLIASLSPLKRWGENVKLAEDAASGHLHGHTGLMLGKAQAILDGADPETILPMWAKTGHFYLNILDPSDPDPITIDRHAHDVAVGEDYGNKSRGLDSKARYAVLALAYRLAARKLGLLPNVTQAIAWVVQIDSIKGKGTRI